MTKTHDTEQAARVCDACGKRVPNDAVLRSDSDGFTACLPAFPRSNFDDRPMEGACYNEEAFNG